MRTANGWRPTGELEVEEAGVAVTLCYAIEVATNGGVRAGR